MLGRGCRDIGRFLDLSIEIQEFGRNLVKLVMKSHSLSLLNKP